SDGGLFIFQLAATTGLRWNGGIGEQLKELFSETPSSENCKAQNSPPQQYKNCKMQAALPDQGTKKRTFQRWIEKNRSPVRCSRFSVSGTLPKNPVGQALRLPSSPARFLTSVQTNIYCLTPRHRANHP